VRYHGTANAIGVAFAGLLGWFLARADDEDEVREPA
jgi:hypothetical protein